MAAAKQKSAAQDAVYFASPAEWRAWLDLARPEGELLRPLAAGSLEVAKAGGVRSAG